MTGSSCLLNVSAGCEECLCAEREESNMDNSRRYQSDARAVGGREAQDGQSVQGAAAKPMTKQQRRVRYMAVTAMLAAAAAVLMYIEFPVPFMPPFIKMDVSDLPALIGSFAMGPLYGVLIALIKNLVHMLVSQSGMVGELCNFLLSAMFVLPAGLIYQRWKTKKGAFAGALTGAIVMAVLSLPINYFIVYPMYTMFMPMDSIIGAYQLINPAIKDGDLLSCLVIFNMPFTFVKGLISCIITFLIYKPLSPVIHGTRR